MPVKISRMFPETLIKSASAPELLRFTAASLLFFMVPSLIISLFPEIFSLSLITAVYEPDAAETVLLAILALSIMKWLSVIAPFSV